MTDNDGSLREPHSGTGAAGTRPTTSRRRRADDGSREQLAVPRARFRSYYGRPVLKPPVWEWRIPDHRDDLLVLHPSSPRNAVSLTAETGVCCMFPRRYISCMPM